MGTGAQRPREILNWLLGRWEIGRPPQGLSQYGYSTLILERLAGVCAHDQA